MTRLRFKNAPIPARIGTAVQRVANGVVDKHDRVVEWSLAPGMAVGHASARVRSAAIRHTLEAATAAALATMPDDLAKKLKGPLKRYVDVMAGLPHVSQEAIQTAVDVMMRPHYLRAWGLGVDRTGPKLPQFFIPGFMAQDASLLVLRAVAENAGHETGGSGIRVSQVGDLGKIYELIKSEFLKFHKENGGKPVILVGHSLGGLDAEVLAKDPELTSLMAGIIKITSPKNRAGALPHSLQLADLLLEVPPELEERLNLPLPRNIRVHSIISRVDNVISSESASDPRYESNMKIWAGHVGAVVSGPILKAFLQASGRLSHWGISQGYSDALEDTFEV